MIRVWYNNITGWVYDNLDSVRIVSGCILKPADSKALWTRVAAFAGAMCSGGILIHGDEKPASPGGAGQAAAMGISTCIQFDGDIVMRLDRRYRQLTPPEQTAALDSHIRAVLSAIHPMREIQALITATTLLLRTIAIAVLGWFQILPVLKQATVSLASARMVLIETGLLPHLISAALLIAAGLAPRWLRWLMFKMTLSKLSRQIALAWEKDKLSWTKRREGFNAS